MQVSQMISDEFGMYGLKKQYWYIKWLGKGIRFIVLYPPKRSHELPPLAGLYTRKPF